MALLRWTKKYSVGVKAFDDQHIVLVKILNELHAAMLKGKAQSVAGVLVPQLMSYANDHFSTEEQIMESTKYPGLAEHRAEHRDLTGKAGEYVASYEQGDQTIYPELLRFVGDWLHNHMLTVDKQYTAWLNEHGVR
jgi:hemerythrin-like metal-binding protein